MKLTVITVTWNSKEFILKQIESVCRAAKHVEFEHIIVDNGSTDGTVALIREHFPHIQIIIENGENVGFAVANNQATSIARGEYLFFLNPDMEMQSGSLDVFVNWMDSRPEVGIVGPKLTQVSGSFSTSASPRRFPRVWEQIALIIKLPHFFPRLLDSYHMVGFLPDREQEVDSVRGSCMLMRRVLIDDIGFAFDPRYFIWYEDVDICREVIARGYRVVYTPIISVVDHVGRSFALRDSVWKQRLFTQSMFVYFRKWESWWKWVLIAIFRPFGIVLVWIASKMNREAT